MAYSGGESVNAVVADLGSYSSKLGYAGEDYPRSYFRSNVAFQREDQKEKDGEANRRRRISKINCDFYTRPLCMKDDNDDSWEVGNPVDPTTGLWYDGDATYDKSGADWDDLLQQFIRYGYSSALGTVPENFPLLLVERSYNPPPIRQQVLEILMEEVNVPAAFLARDATMACYATGRTTGTVVDIGYNGTVVTPVYDGYVEQKGIRRSFMGGLQMDQKVLETLDSLAKKPFMPLYQVRRANHAKRMEPIHRLARLDVARQAKEMGAGATVATSSADHQFNAPHVTCELPDGQKVDVPSAQRIAVPNLLFGTDEESTKFREETTTSKEKELSALLAAASHVEDEKSSGDDEKDKYSESAAIGLSTRRSKKAQEEAEKKKKQKVPFSNRHLQRACVPYLQNHLEQVTSSAIPAMVCDAAFRSDRDQQASLMGNVVLCGGGACLGPTDQAVPDVLREQVEAIIHTHTPGWRVKVLAPSMQERAVCSWLGGSILGSLGTFHDMWITRDEYEEWGSAIVNRKCP